MDLKSRERSRRHLISSREQSFNERKLLPVKLTGMYVTSLSNVPVLYSLSPMGRG
jgi:hypothetical protein